MKEKILLIALTVLLVIINCNVLNAKSISDTSAINLDSIFVHTRINLQQQVSYQNRGVIRNTEEIKNGIYRTTPEALIGLGGIFIQKTNHGGGSAFIRGLTGNQTLIIVDGIRLNNSTFRYGPNQYLNTVDIFSIDKIEVAKGIGAVAYGSDALGGTILLQTKEQNFSTQPRWIFNNLSRFTSSNIEKTNRTEWGYSSNKIAWDGGVSIKNYGDLLGGGDIGIQRPSGYNELDYNTKLKVKLKNHTSLVFSSQMTQQKNIPIYHKILLENYKINQTDLQSRSLNYLKYTKQYSQAWRKEFLITTSYQQSIEQRSNQKNNSLTLRKETDTIKTISIIAELISKPINIWTISTGFDYYQDKVNSIYKDINPLTNSTAYKRGLYPNNANYINKSIFNLHQIDFNRWNIQTGFRFNTVAINFKESTLGSVSVKTSSFVGDLSISYQITKKNLVYTSVANGYRSPNVDDMGTLGIVDFRYEVPAYDLKPEKSLNTELGYKYVSERLHINISTYYMQLSDIIARIKKDGFVIDGYAVYNKTNIESAYIKGFEVNLEKKIGNNLHWSSNTTYTYGQNLTKNEPMRRIPPMFGQNSFIWKKKKINIQINHLYAGAQKRLAQGDKDDNRIGKYGTPQWNVFNILQSFEIKHLRLQIGLLNILNEKYKTHGSGIYAMGRALTGSALISF